MKTVYALAVVSVTMVAHAQVQLFLPFDKQVPISAHVDEDVNYGAIQTASGFTDATCVDWNATEAAYCYGTTYDNHTGTDYDVPNELMGNAYNPNYVPYTVYSAEKGKVIAVGFDEDGYGNYVKIQHAGNIQTLYGHLKETWVDEGNEVEVHSELGIAGNTGDSTGDHLHFEVRKVTNSGVAFIDPYQISYQHLWCNGTPSVFKGVACNSLVTWHPAGTLISPEISNGGIVYLVGSNGVTLYPIVDDLYGTFTAMKYDWKKVVYVSDKEMDCFEESTNKVSSVPFGFFERESWFGMVKKIYFYYGLPQDSNRYKIEVTKGVQNLVVKSWGFDEIPKLSEEEIEKLYSQYPKAHGHAFVREGTVLESDNGGMYIVSATQAHPITKDVLLKAGYNLNTTLKIPQSDVEKVVSEIGEMYTEGTFATCGAQMCAAFQKPNQLSACVIAEVVDEDGDGSLSTKDCNDHNAKQNADSTEICSDGIDNNCNGKIDEVTCNNESDEDEKPTCALQEDCNTPFDDNCNGDNNDGGGKNCTFWYRDNDKDGCSDGKVKMCLCTGNEEFSVDAQNCITDCNDQDNTVGPFNVEQCGDDKDNNCNGVIDENCGECIGKVDDTCNDGNPCTANDHCTMGLCVGNKKTCNDNNDCTDDSCDITTGCENTPSYKLCNDNNACSTQDRCSGGFCNGVAISCDDGNPCTADFCSAQIGCHHEYAIVACDDDNPCTTNDFCNNGSCKGDDSCECSGDSDCKDGNICTYDRCVQGMCTHEQSIGACESDNNNCTEDVCSGGMCVHNLTQVCHDDSQCTQDECTPNGCVFTPISNIPCDDNDACTGDDQCHSGLCMGKNICTNKISSNVVQNGSFENGNEHWIQEIHVWESANMQVQCYSAYDGSCSVNFFNSLLQDYNIQMWQEVATKQNHRYKFSVWIKPEYDNFSIRLWIGKKDEPYTVYHHGVDCMLMGNMWNTCATEFTATESDMHTKFSVVLGNLLGNAMIDMVEIIEIED